MKKWAWVLLSLSLLGEDQVPRTWDDAALADWATPIAALNTRPGHFSTGEYYRAPVDNLRTYPVYWPGREPEGYWKMLNSIGPQPLIEPAKLKTEGDWIAAGKRAFEEYDLPLQRVSNQEAITAVRSKEILDQMNAGSRGRGPLPDGTMEYYRWVPTADGVKLGFVNCAACHTRIDPDGTKLEGLPNLDIANGLGRYFPNAVPSTLLGDSARMGRWRSFYVPWIKDDINENLKEAVAIRREPGTFPRWNGSPYYTTKIPDLIGIRERKYIDHTATHLNRGIADIMRYAAVVTYADISDFGPYRILTDEQRKVPLRAPDELLYALALYIDSLQPPVNPNRVDDRTAAGKEVFEQQGCVGCHTPPLYNNNKLTFATGFTPPKDLPKTLDVIPISVGTDPGSALKTRKGTGFYKVPSLKGVWYRGHLLHDGSLTSLEEMFNPARLSPEFKPSGWNPPGVTQRAIIGHEFGLKLAPAKRAQLIAFLKTL